MDDDEDPPRGKRTGRRVIYTQPFQAGEQNSRRTNKKKDRAERTNENPAKKAKTGPATDDDDPIDVSGAPPAPTTSAVQTTKVAKIGKKQIGVFRNAGFQNFSNKHLKAPKVFAVAFPNLASQLNLIDEKTDYERSLDCFQYSTSVFSSGNSLATQTWIGLNPIFGFRCFRIGDDQWLFRCTMGNLSSLNVPFNVFDFRLTEEQYQKEVKPLLAPTEEPPEAEHNRLGSSQYQFQLCGRRAVFLSRWQLITDKKKKEKKEKGEEWIEEEEDWNEDKSQAILYNRVFKPLLRALRHGGESLRCFLAESVCSSLDLLLKALCNDFNRRIEVTYCNMEIHSSYKIKEGDRLDFEKWDDKKLSTQDRATKNTPKDKSAIQRTQEDICSNKAQFGLPYLRLPNPKDKSKIQAAVDFGCTFPMKLKDVHMLPRKLESYPISMLPSSWKTMNIAQPPLDDDDNFYNFVIKAQEEEYRSQICEILRDEDLGEDENKVVFHEFFMKMKELIKTTCTETIPREEFWAIYLRKAKEEKEERKRSKMEQANAEKPACKDRKKGSKTSKSANKTRSSSGPNPSSTGSTTPTQQSVKAPEQKKKPLKLIALISVLCCTIIALSIALIIVISQDAPVPSAPDSPTNATVKPRNVCETPACITLAHQLQNWQNTSVDPCQNFYKYSCGRYQEHVAFEGSSLTRKTKILEGLIEDFLMKNVSSTSKSENSMKMLYAKCKKREFEKLKFYQEVYRHISSIGHWSHFKSLGGSDVNFTKWLSGLRLLRKSWKSQAVDFGSFSIKFNEHSKMTIEPKYIILPPEVDMMTRIKTVLHHNGIDTDDILSSKINQLKELERKLYDPSRLNSKSMIEYEKADLKSRIPEIDFDAIIKDMMRSNEGVEVVKRNTFVSDAAIFFGDKQLSNLLQDPIEVVDLLIYLFINSAVDRYEKYEKEMKQRDCAQVVIENLPHASTRVFVRNFLNKKNRKDVSDLVEREKSSLIEMIKESKQLQENSKKKAVVKVERMKTVIGYAKEFEAPGALDNFYQLNLSPSDSYNGMLMKIERDFTKYYLDYVSKKSVFHPAVLILWANAVYLEDNTLVIPPPIMGDPFFDESYPEYAKIAILGTTIAHEMGHAFDESGVGHDEIGKTGSVLTPVDLKSYLKTSKCFHKQYINYDDPDFGKQNVPDTSLNEIIADIIGERVIWKTFKKLQLSQESKIIGFEDYDIDKLFFQMQALRFVMNRLPKSLSVRAYCYLAFAFSIISIGTSCSGSDLSEKESLAWCFWIIALGLQSISKSLSPRFGFWNASVQFYSALIALFSVTASFHYVENSKSFSEFMKEKETFLTLKAVFATIKYIFLLTTIIFQCALTNKSLDWEKKEKEEQKKQEDAREKIIRNRLLMEIEDARCNILQRTADEWSFISLTYVTTLLVLIAIFVRIVFRIFKNSEFFKYSEFDYEENLPKIEKYDKWNLLVGYYGLAIISTIPQFIVWWVEYDYLVVATLFIIYHILAITLLTIFIYPHIWKYELDYSENLGPFIAIRIFLQTLVTWLFLKEGHFILPHLYCNIWLFIAINEIRTVESDHVQIPPEETNEEESKKEATVLPTEIPREQRRRYVMLYPHGLYQVYQ